MQRSSDVEDPVPSGTTDSSGGYRREPGTDPRVVVRAGAEVDEGVAVQDEVGRGAVCVADLVGGTNDRSVVSPASSLQRAAPGLEVVPRLLRHPRAVGRRSDQPLWSLLRVQFPNT